MSLDFLAPDGRWTTRTAMYLDIQDWIRQSTDKPRRALSIDRNPELEAIVLERWPGLSITHAIHPEIDCQALPYEDASFDLVFSDQVIEHVPAPWIAATELERILVPGGLGIHTACAFNPRHGPPAFEDYYRFLPAGLAALFGSSEIEQRAEWGNRDVLLHHLEMDGQSDGSESRRFSLESARASDGRYPWTTWIIARRKPLPRDLWEWNEAQLWREVGSEATRDAVVKILSALTFDPVVTPKILDRIRRPDPRTGRPYIDGRMLLHWLARRFRPGNVLEVGVRRGFSLAAISWARPEAALFGFDSWVENYSGSENPGPQFVVQELRRLCHRGPIYLVSGDSHQTLPAFFSGRIRTQSDQASPLPSPSGFDLVNIDGDHSIPGSWADLLALSGKVAPKGALVFDDLNVDYIPEGEFRVGQYGVWTAFKRRFAADFRFFEYLDSVPGLGLAVRYPESRPELAVLLDTTPGPDEVRSSSSPVPDPEQKEQDLVARLVKPGMVAFDIGAHVGKYTRLFSNLVGPQGRVFAFEPTPSTFRRLQTAWGPEVPSHVTLIPKLVTERPGAFPFHLFPETYSTWNSLGSPRMPDPQNPAQLVPIAREMLLPGTSLDVFCDVQGIERIDYLKLDVEGAESEALRGMDGLLSRGAIRFLQFEISQNPLAGRGHQAKETFAILERHGYVCRTILEEGRLGSVIHDSDAFYANYLAHRPGDPALDGLLHVTPVHFLTIVLNGEPFIEYHFREFSKLQVPWHWHIVEGLAEQHHDSSWMLHYGGRIDTSLHRGGRSHDGTSEYLDGLAKEHSDRVTIYRKAPGVFWDGKLEMVNAPLDRIQEECLLWQIDADELWTAEQIHEAHRMFEAEPLRRTAFYRCHFFVGPDRLVSTRDTYGNPTDRAGWNRTWRYRPGCRWESHSPPVLVELRNGGPVDLFTENPFLHDETEARGLVFQHFAYADERQLAFKEIYYGYAGAVDGWKRLQACGTFPARLGDFFPWVRDEAQVMPVGSLGVLPLADHQEDSTWRFHGEPSEAFRKGVRATERAASGPDPTVVDSGPEFAQAVRDLFRSHRPRRLLEAGTCLGESTTATIAEALRELEIFDGRFLSLEANPSHCQSARKNLASRNLDAFVQVVNCFPVPRTLLSACGQIESRIQGTDLAGVPDDGLRKALRALEWRPDFVLLGSGDFMGDVAFDHLISLVEGPCFVVLDDASSVKYQRSLEQVRSDPRFEILTLSRGKASFRIARFDPGPVTAKPLADHILWVRLDAIGDAILAASMLEPIRSKYPEARISVVCQPHVAELYEACPFVDDVLTVDKVRAAQDQAYLKAVLGEVAELGADVCLHSVYSREPLADAIAGVSGALRRIAHHGDDHNRNPGDRPQFDALYTELVPPGEAWDLELCRHEAFLGHLGIKATGLQPVVWTVDEDETRVQTLLQEEGLENRRLIGLFPGAQYGMRVYGGYAAALQPLLEEDPELVPVVLGSASERELGQTLLDSLPFRSVNLCGRLTLRETAVLLRRCALGVGAETGLAHMACAVGTPNVVVLGGGHFGRFMPYFPLTTCAVLPLVCFLCDWSCPYARPHCVKDLRSEVLTAAIRTALARPSDRPRIVAQDGWNAPPGGPEPLDLALHIDGAKALLEKVPYAHRSAEALAIPGPRGERAAIVTFPHRPLPGNTGAKTRFLSQLSMLRDLGYRIHLLASSFFSDEPWNPEAIHSLYAQYGALTHLHVGSHADRAWSAVHALEKRSLDLRKRLVPGFVLTFRGLLGEYPPDLLLVNYVEWAGLLDAAELPGGTLTVQENHDLTSINAVLQADLEKHLGEEPFSLKTAHAKVLVPGFPRRPDPGSLPAFREEAAALDRFDLLLAISGVEAGLVQAQATHAHVLHLPMSFEPRGTEGNSYGGQPVFLASPNYFNIQAYLHAAARLAPGFPKGMELQVIGGIGKIVVPYPGLKLRGYVENLGEAYRQAPFATCPLLSGTGQQVKIVEAMAHGIPVIAYREIARSSPIVDGVNGLLADSPEDFLAHVARLWEDRALCRRLGRAALETIERECSYRRGLDAFEQALARFSQEAKA